VNIPQIFFEVTISLKKNYITERKRTLHYIHLRILYVGFMVRVGTKLRC